MFLKREARGKRISRMKEVLSTEIYEENGGSTGMRCESVENVGKKTGRVRRMPRW